MIKFIAVIKTNSFDSEALLATYYLKYFPTQQHGL